MLKRNRHATDRGPRPLRSLGAALLTLSMAAFMPSMLSDTAAKAATSPSVPVAGVLAFGIGAGQLGIQNFQNDGGEGIAFDAKGDLFVADTGDNRVIEYTPSSATSYPRTGTQSTATGSNYAMLAATPGNGIAFQSDFNYNVSGASYTLPVWLKLTRSGSTITAYTSTDGTTWTTAGTATVSLTDPVTIGLFTCAHNASAHGHGHLQQRQRHRR